MDYKTDITRQIPWLAESGTRMGRRCPDPSTLVAYVGASLSPSRRSELEEHLADCSYCLGQVGFLVRTDSPEQPAVPVHLLDAVQTRRSSWSTWIPKPAKVMVTVAVLAVVTVAVGLHLDRLPRAEPVDDSTGHPTAERSVRNGTTQSSGPEILEPLEGSLVSGTEIWLRWSEIPQALQYAVQLVDLRGDVVWEHRSIENQTSIPSTQLVSGQRYFVWVEAHLRGGGSIRSDPVGFQVAID